MSVAYPTYLPKPSRDGYSRQFQQELQRTEMDDGNFRSRRKFKSQAVRYALTWNLTDIQLSVFEAFIVYDLAYATKEFDLPLYSDETVKVKFTGTGPSKSRSDNRWSVTGEVIEIREGSVLSQIGSLPTWPAALPFPENSDYQLTTNDLFIEGNIGGGKVDTRSRFTFKEEQTPVSWILSHEERALFWSFWKNTLQDGLLPFLIPLYNGQGVNYVKGRFIAHPSESENGAAYKISASVGTNYLPKLRQSDYNAIKTKSIC